MATAPKCAKCTHGSLELLKEHTICYNHLIKAAHDHLHLCIYYNPELRNYSAHCSPWSKPMALWQPALDSSHGEHSMSDVAALLDSVQTCKQLPSLVAQLRNFQKTRANQHVYKSERNINSHQNKKEQDNTYIIKSTSKVVPLHTMEAQRRKWMVKTF